MNYNTLMWETNVYQDKQLSDSTSWDMLFALTDANLINRVGLFEDTDNHF